MDRSQRSTGDAAGWYGKEVRRRLLPLEFGSSPQTTMLPANRCGITQEVYEEKEEDDAGRWHPGMTSNDTISRRSFLSLAATTACAVPAAAAASGHIPVGLELYSVRDELARD